MFPDFTELERLRYRQGQRLLSRDFRDQAAIDAQLRWWHNRALHNAYGIAFGLEATMKSDGEVVEIAAGVAYDCFGRELIVQEPRTIRVPDEPENLALLLRYRNGPFHPGGSPAVCISAAGAVVNASELVWESSDGLTFKDGVVVCRRPYDTVAAIRLPVTMRWLVLEALPGKVNYDYEKNVLAVRGVMSREDRDTLLALPLSETSGLKGLDLAEYRRALFDLFERSQIDYGRSKGGQLARPRIANGATIAGSTNWIPWQARDTRLIGLQVEVDTSAAGFTRPPCYFASLQGAPPLGESLPRIAFEHTDLGSSEGFVFRFWAPILMLPLGSEKDGEGILLALARKLKLFVRWWGVEHDGAVEGAQAP